MAFNLENYIKNKSMNTTFTWLLSFCFLFFLNTEKIQASSFSDSSLEFELKENSSSLDFSEINSPEKLNINTLAPSDHFRSAATGDWSNSATWESSTNGIDGWSTATSAPGAGAASVTIRDTHKITVDFSVTTKNASVQSGGELIMTANSLQFSDNGIQLTIEKNGVLSFNDYPGIAAEKVLIETGGILRINNLTENKLNNLSEQLEIGTGFRFENRAIIDWNCNATITNTIQNYFRVAGSGSSVIFRLSKNFGTSGKAFGGASGETSFNAIVEVIGEKTMYFSGKTKNFHGGVQPKADSSPAILNIRFSTNSLGKFRIGNSSTIPLLGLDNTLLTLKTQNDKLAIRNGGLVPAGAFVKITSNIAADNFTFKRVNGLMNIQGTLDLGSMKLDNSSNDVGGGVKVSSTGLLKTSNVEGLIGNNATISDEKFELESGSRVEYYNLEEEQLVSSQPIYSNLIISGLALIYEHVTVDNILTITETGNLIVDETTAGELQYTVLEAKKGIQVASPGILLIKNNSQLMQDTDAVNSGDIQLERRFTFSEGRGQYNFVTSPLMGQPIKTIYPGNPAVIKYNENTNFFVSGGQGDYVVGKGYGIKEAKATVIPEGYVDAQFTGVPFNGNGFFTLAYTDDNPTAGGEHGFNLVGNPYPSNLDLEELFRDNTGKIGSTIYFWDNRGHPIIAQQGSDYDGSNYATFNIAALTGIGVGQAADNLDRVPTKYVRPATGFIVQALPGQNGQPLEFNNSQRAIENDSPEFFGKNGSKDMARYWLTMQTPSGLEYMTAVVYFWKGNNDFAMDDSVSNFTSDDIYTFAEEQQVGINGRSVFEKADVVQMGVRLFETGSYTISIYDQEGVFANGQTIYLKDKDLDIIHNLSQSDYTFEGDSGEYNSRFELVYRLDNAQLAEDMLIADNSIRIDIIDKHIVAKSKEDKIVKIALYDLNSRPIYQNDSVNANEFKIPSQNLGHQIIFVKMETENGEIKTRKIILQP